ncbi:MAG: hypothetical protein AAGH78_04100 [Cyanobacteria bacterium P01_H01_bin.58]
MHSCPNSSNATLLELQRQRLEMLLDHSAGSAYRPNRMGKFFVKLGQGLVHWLTSGDTPKISKFVRGDIEVWQVYDPAISQTLYFDNETELRTWMDQRYYQ